VGAKMEKPFNDPFVEFSYDTGKLQTNSLHQPDRNNFLKYVHIFSDLDEESIEKISKLCIRKTFNKESVVLFEDEAGSALFLIIKGRVKISRITNDGKEAILSILNEYDFFGDMAIIDNQSRSASAIAMSDSELFIIQRNEFMDLLQNHPEISINLLKELTRRLRNASMIIKSLSLNDAEGKVATVILQLANILGKIKQGIVEIEKLPFQHEIANMAGTSRETISRVLHTLEKKGFIKLKGSRLKIFNYEKFKALFN